jgi:phage repressor protein C with HTH and peptisase S24 domain
MIATWQVSCQLAICHLAVANFCHLANNLPMANRIREIRRAKDITLESLAEETGISTSYLSRIEGGSRKASLENLIRIARALGSEPEDLSDEFDIEDIEHAKSMPLAKPQASETGDVANLSIRGGMGLGSTEEIIGDESGQLYADHVNGFWRFPDIVKAGWRNMPHVYSVPVTGDSMEPTITSGSYVFLDMTHTVPAPEDIYACDYGDGLTIKRLQLIPRSDKIMVMSDNERYSDYELRREDVRVYGRVVAWFQWRG